MGVNYTYGFRHFIIYALYAKYMHSIYIIILYL